MSTMWRRAMLYLGLGPDDEYEDDLSIDPPVREAMPSARPVPAQGRPAATRPASSGGRPTQQRPAAPPAGRPSQPSRPLPGGEAERGTHKQTPSNGDPMSTKPKPVVRPVPAAAKPFVVVPENFNQAQEVGDRFKANQPVILNLQAADKTLSRRLLDFSSGLCYALGGNMEKVATQVYLLTPTNVEVSLDERRRLAERGLHDA